ncbi:hypothetical protein [Rhodococcus koreensis]
MNSIVRAILHAILRLPAALAQLRHLPRQLWRMIKAICRRIRLQCKGQFPTRPMTGGCCLNLTDATSRPDPLIYSQPYLTAQGLAVTWDNPDIELFDNGVLVPSSDLEPDHEYEVRVRVWNGSYNCAAINLPVHLSFLTFGIATTSTPIAVATIPMLGAKGTAAQPATATFRWRTPDRKGHYCLQALLDCPDDANPDNNLGQENVLVGRLASPATFRFTVRNQAAVHRAIVFEADTYQMPTGTTCGDDYADQFGQGRFPSRLAESRAHWAWAKRTQAYGAFPVPDDWTVVIDPSRIDLGRDEERAVDVTIEPTSPAFSGTKSFNIHGFALAPGGSARQRIGGITLHVSR